MSLIHDALWWCFQLIEHDYARLCHSSTCSDLRQQLVHQIHELTATVASLQRELQELKDSVSAVQFLIDGTSV